MHPTGDATILTGATSTAFDAAAVNNENPYLVFDDNLNVWKTTEDTPLYENALTSVAINGDIEGQERPNSSNPGADHFSMTSIRYTPLTVADVGPYAYAGINTSTSNEHELSRVVVYPIPANNILHLKNIDNEISKVEIVNLEGRVVFSREIINNQQNLTISTSSFMNGIYISLRF